MRLKDWLERTPNATRRQIREACGVSRQAVHAWINETQTPKLAHILKIRDLTEGEVTLDDFAGKEATDCNR